MQILWGTTLNIQKRYMPDIYCFKCLCKIYEISQLFVFQQYKISILLIFRPEFSSWVKADRYCIY